jgi:hypothetical protein
VLERPHHETSLAPPSQDAEARERIACKISIPREWLRKFQRTGAAPTIEDDARQFPRFYHCRRAVLYYRQTLPAVPRKKECYAVITGDISRAGVRFLHEEELYPREQMLLALPDGKQVEIEIARCARLNDQCFEVGARFLQLQPLPHLE